MSAKSPARDAISNLRLANSGWNCQGLLADDIHPASWTPTDPRRVASRHSRPLAPIDGAGENLRPSGKHARNRAICYRATACKDCRLKRRCTFGVQRTIHRLSDQAALDRMEARICVDPRLVATPRCTVVHPFGTIKRVYRGGRFLTRGLRAVKAEAALSTLAFNVLHAVNAFGAKRRMPAG